jgi:peptidoglycan/LPS O-acetylase OafA/YrhL
LHLETVLKALSKNELASHPALHGPHLLFEPPPEQPPVAETQVHGGRLAAIDVLRGVAMLLGIYIHAAISYLPQSLAELNWAIREDETSPVLAALFWWIHAFRLPLFFVIAGFFTVLVYDTKGARAFLVHRARRLLVPLVVGLAVMLPLSYVYFWICGYYTGLVTEAEFEHFVIDPQVLPQLFGPMHLWFLQDLLLLSLIAWTVWRVKDWLGKQEHSTPRSAPQRWPAWTTWVAALAPLLLAVPAAVILAVNCAPLIAHHNSFVPSVPRLIYYGLFFAVGTALYGHRAALPQVFAWPRLHLMLSLAATAGLLWLLPQRLQGQADALGRLAFAGCGALVAWLSVFAFMGLALRYFTGRHPVAHYLADASYWIYLIHMPLVCVMQLLLYELSLGPELKCGIVLACSIPVALASYQWLVRYSAIGACLHGPRKRA